ncbi:MAG: hypothetical protein CVU55_10800 [Deltaproteobacteria bacterium HGW-Deltaproteobacteria-13]|jgi:hypothetical protein|nr:MAG: hypothetical protein CVU55_10800 [Deltaproteobacteria bacterium HGW-Deltaproteobacteria-13]
MLNVMPDGIQREQDALCNHSFPAFIEDVQNTKKYARSLSPVADRILKRLRRGLKKITNFYFWKNKIMPLPKKREQL